MKYKLLSLLLLFAFSCSYAKTEGAPDYVSLQLQWKHQFQFAGYYVARELGFYKEAGLEVEIREYHPGTNVIDEVAERKSDFGSGRSSLVLHSDRELLLLMAVYQSSPFILLAKKRDDLKTLQDFVHKRIMLSDALEDTASIYAMLRAEGINTKDLVLQSHSMRIEDLINGKTDLMSAYISNEPYLLQNRHISYTIFDPKEYGFDFYGDILFTSKKFAQSYPDVTRRFYEATRKGCLYAFSHIEETAKLITQKYNTQHKSLDALIYEGKTLKKLAFTKVVPFGKLENARLREIENTYRLLGFGKFNKNDFSDMIYTTSEQDNKPVGKNLLLPLAVGALLIFMLLGLKYILSRRENRLLQKSLENFELLIESTIEGIIIFDADGYCLRTNQVARKLFRYSEDEMHGIHATELMSDNSRAFILKHMRIANQKPYEAKLRRRDGSCFPAILRGRDIVWNDRRIRVSTVIDISEMKALQEELQFLNKNLEAKVAAQVEDIRRKDQMLLHQSKLASMGEMIGAIAHQWRQPLNALNINIQNLDDDYAEGLIDAAFIENFIKQNSQIIAFMSKTIDDFRNFFRIDKMKESFSLKEAIETTVALQQAQLRSKNIILETEGKDMLITGYKHEFLQVLLNLISNAVDQIRKKGVREGKIMIRLTGESMIVEDNAGGIDPKILDRVFEPYFTTKAPGEGTGLGLYISKVIIEKNMGGRLEVRNSSWGAVFEILFPKTAIVHIRQKAVPALES